MFRTIFNVLTLGMVLEGKDTRVAATPISTAQALAMNEANIDRTRIANKFEPCISCGSMAYVPRGRTEVVVRSGRYYYRQILDCSRCGVRQTMGRRIDEDMWVRNTQAVHPYLYDYT